MESKKHKTERWAKDSVAGKDGEVWAKLKLKARHPFDEVGSSTPGAPYDIYRKKKVGDRK